jgi:arabinofuranosyltransferase
VIAFATVVALNAWLCDDAYITFRQVDNLVHGHGFDWNPGERVQAYTHPLWALLLVPFLALSGEVFFTPMLLGIALAGATAWVIAFRVARGPAAAVLGCVVLLLSRAVVDYSTSGLENGLTHLLLVGIFVLAYTGTPSRRALEAACLLGGLLVVNRLDLSLVAVPLLALPVLQAGPQLPRRRAAAIFLAPIVAWELFALVYYGTLVPNTAFAKLGTDIERARLLESGGQYLLGMIRHDPTGSAVLALAVAVTLHQRALRGIGVALVAYVAYTAWIGGDFMVGRFYSPLVVLGVCVLVRLAPELHGARHAVLIGVPLAILAVATPVTTLGVPPALEFADCLRENGPSDERCVYFPYTSLFRHARGPRLPVHPWAAEGQRLRGADERVVYASHIGFLGYHAGPRVHIIDRHGLADPFLGRLPPQRQVRFYPGHHYRCMDDEYLASLQSGRPAFEDRRLREIYRRIRSVTRGPIFDGQRWSDIVTLAVHGVPEDEIDLDRWRHAEMLILDDTPSPYVPEGTFAEDFGTAPIYDDGAELRLDPPRPVREVEIALGQGADWTFAFRDARRTVAARVTTVGLGYRPLTKRSPTHLTRIVVPVPAAVRGRLVAMRILPETGGRARWWVGDVVLR